MVMSSFTVFRQLVGVAAVLIMMAAIGFAQPTPDVLVASLHDSADLLSFDPDTSCAEALNRLERENLVMTSVAAIPHVGGDRSLPGALYTFTSKPVSSYTYKRAGPRVVLLRCRIVGLFEATER